MKTKKNTTELLEQEIDMESLHKLMDEVAKKNELTEKEIEARERFKNAVWSEEVIQSIRENNERAKKSSSK